MCFLYTSTAPIWDEAYVKNRDDTPPCTTSRYLRSVLKLKITNFLQNRIISLCGGPCSPPLLSSQMWRDALSAPASLAGLDEGGTVILTEHDNNYSKIYQLVL